MTVWYLDTSAALKFLVDEVESAALVEAFEATQPDCVATCLLETELRRAVWRYDELSQTDVTDLLEGISLHEVPPSLFREAGLIPGDSLRSLDSIHLAAALRLGVDQLVTYDTRLIAAAEESGMHTLTPS